MWFMFFFVVALAAVALGLNWLIAQPGSITLDFAGWQYEASLPVAIGGMLLVVAGIILIWAIVSALWRMPRRIGGGSRERRRENAFNAISQGLIAVGSGDVARARKAAHVAQRLMPGAPLTQLLTAQAAQLGGDRRLAEETFQKMTLSPETKLLGLRGLHVEAKRREDTDAAHHFAKEAHEVSPLPWAGGAMLEHHAAQGEWEKARSAIEASLAVKAIDVATAQRRRAVIETAMAMEKERDDPHSALQLAYHALKRRPGFTPAALAGARILMGHGKARKAQKLIESAWSASPHPELAAAYAQATPNDTNAQRLVRMERLMKLAPDAPEGRHAVAEAALAARDFGKARAALAALIGDGKHPTAHSCLLMAEIEDAQNGPSGPVREWLARGSRAPRDPVWLADGIASDHWLPISPTTKQLDAFEWKAPPNSAKYLTADGAPNIPAAFLNRPVEPPVIESQSG